MASVASTSLDLAPPGADPAVDPAYMPQLDALRALAVLGVMAHHFNPRGLASQILPLGMGVRLFFVLSGFLITSILLRCRDVIESTGQSWGTTLARFYVRRFLRIFPIYYLVLAILYLLGVAVVRQSIVWHLAYLSNVRFAMLGYADGFTGHLWSLSVEEQFYLVWPWFVLLLPRRWLIWWAGAVILLGPLYRWRAAHLGWNHELASYLTFANIDVLGAGAMLALLWSAREMHRGSKARTAIQIVGFGLGGISLITLLTLRAISRFHPSVRPNFYFVTLDSAMALTFMAIVDAAAVGIRGPVGRAMSWKPLLYLGKISYGVYVYHALTPHILQWLLEKINLKMPGEGWGRLFACAFATIALAALSWHLLERPINSLKRFFPYKATA